jgi:hypothetical protein
MALPDPTGNNSRKVAKQQRKALKLCLFAALREKISVKSGVPEESSA